MKYTPAQSMLAGVVAGATSVAGILLFIICSEQPSRCCQIKNAVARFKPVQRKFGLLQANMEKGR